MKDLKEDTGVLQKWHIENEEAQSCSNSSEVQTLGMKRQGWSQLRRQGGSREGMVVGSGSWEYQ